MLNITKISFWLLCIGWPLFILGDYVAGYPVNVPFLAVLLFIPVSLHYGKVSGVSLALFSLMALYFVGNVVVIGDGSSLKSIILMVLFATPLVFTLQLSEKIKSRIVGYLRVGLYASLIFQLMEVGYYIITSDFIQALIPTGMAQSAVSVEFYSTKIGRFFSLFDEPAHQALYLVFAYAILDQVRGLSLNLRLATVFGILLTQSLSGLILLLLYVGYSVFSNGLSRRQLRIVLFTSVSFVISVVALQVIGIDIFGALVNRIARISLVLGSDDFSREGARVNAYRILLQSLTDNATMLNGVGYGRPSPLIIEFLAHENFKVANVLVFLGVNVGLLGLISFYSFIFFSLRNVTTVSILLVIAMQFNIGYLLSPMFWIPIYLIQALCRKK